MKLKTDRGMHALYNLEYHIVMTTKDRKPCINEEVFSTVREQLIKVAKINDCKILDIEFEKDYVHILFEGRPSACLSSIVNAMKATSSRKVREKHSEYLSQFYDKATFWNQSYLLLSSGNVPDNIIEQYVQNHSTQSYKREVII
jgi:putative transposase